MPDLPTKINPPGATAQSGQVIAFPERLLRAALHYAAVGIPIFPLHPTEKKALVKGWQKLATTNERKIREWFKERPDMRIATVAGKRSGIVNLDLDRKRGADGPAALDYLATFFGGLPSALTVATPSGGQHRYYRMPAGVSIRNRAGSIAPGIDVRGSRADGSKGGVIPLPPSAGANGGAYLFDRQDIRPDDFRNLPDLPPWLLFLMIFNRRQRERLASLNITGPESFDGATPDRWEAIGKEKLRADMRNRFGCLPTGALAADIAGPLLRYVEAGIGDELRKVSEATAGHRDQTINDAALRIWSLLHGLDEFGALTDELAQETRGRFLDAARTLGDDDKAGPFEDIAAEKWERCEDDAEARDLSGVAAGKTTAEDDFGDLIDKRKSRVLWIDDEPVTKGIPWLVGDAVPETSIGFLASRRGEGKSFLLMYLALCLAYGAPFFGRQVGKRGGTHIVAAEGGYGVPHRVRAALTEKFARGEADGAKVPITFEKGAPDLLTPAGLKAFIEQMRGVAAEMQRRYGVPLRLLGIDTFAQGFSVTDENDAAAVGKATRAMQAVADALGVTVVSLHHLGKDPSKGMRGSSALDANVDFVFLVKRKGELFLDKCREAEDGIVLGHFDLPSIIVAVQPDGTSVTSCYVRELKPAEWPAHIEEEAKRSESEQALLDALDDVLASKGEMQTPPGENEPQHVARLEDVRQAFYSRHGATTPAANRQAFGRARGKLHKQLRNGEWGGVEWIWAVHGAAPFKQEN
jgi:hypothetical protein